ncbi:hypothetical protein GYMLUDRAFT_42622 [Collybiopsis luxurians FD-317 M1]|uniref:Phospholipase D/nuclease n=1 Tax=Collybiopsis luxurians FD-317 M1 TaxID=944289 RepID=A0A0D0BD60_9AGAR|nr:hypothetical protein GYMLUDRAFT_42622 [Collybiopsis luxurians FD-317 M1]
MGHGKDDDMARAIALSLQDSRISSERDDGETLFQDQLRQAIEASRVGAESQVESTSKVSDPNPPPVHQSTATSSSFLSERAQLEKERLERQKRYRQAMGLPTNDDESQTESEDEEDAEVPSAKKQRRLSSSKSTSNHQTSVPGVKSESIQDPFFWDGEWRPTATRGVEPRKDGKPTFRLSEILGNKQEISFAILSTFAEQNSWIYSFFESSVPVILVAPPPEDGRAGVKNIFPNWVRTSPRLPKGIGCMHMKFMLLFYKTGRLRIVVSTANLIEFDWRDIENAVWLQDIQPLARKAAFDESQTESFQYVLKRVLDGVNVKPALNIMLMQGHANLPIQSTEDLCAVFDWSRVKVHLIPSFAGTIEGWSKVLQTGHTRLMKAVRTMGMRAGNGKNLELEYQGSSLGQYTTQWMNEFYHSARGESAEDWLDKPKSRRAKLPYPPNLRVVFPSFATVRRSQYGEAGASNIFCTRRQWEAQNFPRHMFYDSNSKAGSTLMHTKMMVCTVSSKNSSNGSHGKTREVINVDTDSEDCDSSDEEEIEAVDTDAGWAYLGSHNFTPSAWGYLSGSAFNPIMNTRNYELGIVFPLKSIAEVDKTACFERPPRRYGPKDLPWFREESVYAVH